MKELKIFAIVVVLSGILYWGIEPYAHTKLHPHTTDAIYDFSVEDTNYAKKILESKKANLAIAQASKDEGKIASAKNEVDVAEKILNDYMAFWDDVKKIDLSKGDAVKGAETFMAGGCVGCHGISVANLPAPMDAETASQAYGVVPPDLSTAGKIYDERFLAAIIKNPTMALKLTHKFNDEQPYPMPTFFGAGSEDMNAEIADIVAYLKSVSADFEKQNGKISDKRLFADACQRCHDMKYDKLYTLSNKVNLATYMGSNPPDLSIVIRSKGSEYLHKFINDTQKMLPNTAMPRVGLSKVSEDQLVNYIQKVGDSKKTERESLGWYIMGYFFILGIFAWLWKRKVWSELH
ncbi:cytochrome c1 [Campylobacter sp. faydin G-24]|uniref:Cytochrome c1 n=1 Tax=Campylobacter anatolicus TaxID=2829105 RepID=A0ABS5HGV2_9BACT|nr:c-type cytochrome [Campylobacter anatolicus]MBR8461764.1 cytochrome c1 [Campylobacter anatolicus]MBR8463499.1 cytochrome c1 [Campylobacter anatolicus]MBR8465148.1 cytochrome c1 [Campylobacter anatolicus]